MQHKTNHCRPMDKKWYMPKSDLVNKQSINAFQTNINLFLYESVLKHTVLAGYTATIQNPVVSGI